MWTLPGLPERSDSKVSGDKALPNDVHRSSLTILTTTDLSRANDTAEVVLQPKPSSDPNDPLVGLLLMTIQASI